MNEDQLLFGAGLDEVIQIISRVLLKSGDNIVTADLTFPQYKHHAIIEGAEIKEIPLADGTFDLNGIRNAIDEKTKIVWICNPNNPTGTYVTEDALLNFLKQVPKETYVVVDEAYWEYVVADDYPETIPLLKEFNNLIILRTFSKAYGLAALRIGYAIGNTDLIKKINIARLPFNTSTLAQEAAIAALADQDFIQQCVDQNRASIKQYEKTLTELGVPHYPSQTNFIYVKTEDPQTAFTHFIEKGYIVRPQPGGVRISMGTTEQNEGVLAIIRESFVPTEK